MKKIFNLILFASIIISINACSPSSEQYKIGDKVEDFSLKNIDDKMVSMADYKYANGFVLIFTCNHCPYSIAYEDRIIELADYAREKQYELIAINPNDPELYPEDSFENMKIRAKEKSFNFPYLLDEGQLIYPKFGASKTPHVFILNKKANDLVLVYRGAIDDNHEFPEEVTKSYVKTTLDELSEGREKLTYTETKAIGCSIKDKKTSK